MGTKCVLCGDYSGPSRCICVTMASSGGKRYAQELLRRQFSELSKNPPEGVSVGLRNDDLFQWDVLIVGPAGTPYEEGFFKAELSFPEDFPNSPPDMKFTSEMWHPNSTCVCVCVLIWFGPTGNSRP
eukprot:gb/GECG01013913.1/.p1 GENE.gb/GECG01013913.1/~~gb/GECG01013913.1/.p1  ORF type:complete len:127 (+),score=7.52 gb/GECG01013913.1/:1-381(+)